MLLKDLTPSEDWVWKDGFSAHNALDWPAQPSKDGKSALVTSPRGKRPRVFRKSHWDALSKARKDEQAKREAIWEAKDREAWQALLKEEPAFAVTMMKAKLIASTGVPEPHKGSVWLADIVAKVKTLADTKTAYWTNEKYGAERRGWLTDAVARYEKACGTLREQQRHDDELRENRDAWITPGRRQIQGTILTAKTKDSAYGMTFKMLVELPSGAKVWGSIPRELWKQLYAYHEPADRDTELKHFRGHSVTFTGTIERSKEDPIFGFFSRPSKATLGPVETTE